jgi:hypothetical protein
MDSETALKLAIGMCEQGDVKYQVNDAGDKISTLYGSAAVYVRTSGEGEMLSYVFGAAFVEDIPLAKIDELELFKWVNDCNARILYGRVYARRYETDGVVTFDLIVENEILVNNVQQQEFINALRALWAHADTFDDEAVSKFGGKTAHEIIFGEPRGSADGASGPIEV